MKFLFSLILFSIISSNIFSQTVVSRKIAQRHDNYVNGNWEGQDSLIFNYATTGLETFRLALKGNTNNNWDNFYRSTQQYDFNENLISQVRENWNNSSWVNSTKYNYTYDANNNKTETLYQTWNGGSNSWQNAGRNNYTYNSLNNETQVKGFIWQNNAWNNYTQKNLTYFGDSLVKETQTYSWINNAWKKNEKKNYTYTQQYIISVDISVDGDSVWVPNKRIEYAINTTPVPAINEETKYYDRDTATNLWVPTNKIDYIFNANILQQEVYENYNDQLNIWTDTKRISYLYNTNQQLETITEELNASGWINNTKAELQYDAQQLLETQTDFVWSNNNWENDIETSFQYNNDDSLTYKLTKEFGSTSFTPTKQDFYYYNKFTVGVNDIAREAILMNIYPNPSSNIIHYNLTQAVSGQSKEMIYSLNGKLIWSRSSNNNTGEQQINISNFPVGQYIIRVQSKNMNYTASFIKY